MKRNGFTLVELLVVIAILVVLAAILFPVFRSARASLNSVRCVSHLRQIGHAVRMYLDDHDGTYPPGAYSSIGDVTTWDWSWHDLLAYYVQSYEPFRCPVTPDTATARTSYGVNRGLSKFHGAEKEVFVPIPGDVPYVTEKLNEDWPFFVNGEIDPHWQPLNPRHRGRVQVLFCDGHVSAVWPKAFGYVIVRRGQ